MQPLFTGYDVLYSNINLLNEYDRPIPKTWDELIETSRYILREEKAKGNSDLVAFNGLFHSKTKYLYINYLISKFY